MSQSEAADRLVKFAFIAFALLLGAAFSFYSG